MRWSGRTAPGKSTLMNILYGMNKPTGGEVYIKGQKMTEFSPKNAIAHGVGMVHQHFMLVPSFTVAQNIVLNRSPAHGDLLRFQGQGRGRRSAWWRNTACR